MTEEAGYAMEWQHSRCRFWDSGSRDQWPSREQHSTPRLTATVATTDLSKKTSRAAERGRLDPAKIKSIADQRDEELSKIGAEVSEASMDRVGEGPRQGSRGSSPTRRGVRPYCSNAGRPAAAITATTPDANAGASGKGCLPIQKRLQHCCRLRPGRTVVALPHRFGLLLSRRYPIARSR